MSSGAQAAGQHDQRQDASPAEQLAPDLPPSSTPANARKRVRWQQQVATAIPDEDTEEEEVPSQDIHLRASSLFDMTAHVADSHAGPAQPQPAVVPAQQLAWQQDPLRLLSLLLEVAGQPQAPPVELTELLVGRWWTLWLSLTPPEKALRVSHATG
jgi:hypothetical protein